MENETVNEEFVPHPAEDFQAPLAQVEKRQASRSRMIVWIALGMMTISFVAAGIYYLISGRTTPLTQNGVTAGRSAAGGGDSAVSDTAGEGNVSNALEWSEYVSRDSAYKFMYPGEVFIKTEDNSVDLVDSSDELVVRFMENDLGEKSVLEIVKEELIDNSEPEIVSIGPRSGYRAGNRMYFPLQLDSYLKIVDYKGDEISEKVVMTLEFLPTTLAK